MVRGRLCEEGQVAWGEVGPVGGFGPCKEGRVTRGGSGPVLGRAMWGGACHVMRAGSRGRGVWVLEVLRHHFRRLNVLLGPEPESGPVLGPEPEPEPGLGS